MKSVILEYFFIIIQLCRVTKARTETEWHFGMKISSDGPSGVNEFYLNPHMYNETRATLEDLKAYPREHYKSCAMSLLHKAVRIRVDVHKTDQVKASFLFGTNTLKDGTWFWKRNLLSLTYDESVLEHENTIFSSGNEGLVFTIYQYAETCETRRRLIRVIDLTDNKPYCTSLPAGVWVLYSPMQTMVRDEEMEIADYMTIYIQTEQTILEGAELDSWISQTKNNLTVKFNSTSSYKRTKVSVYDSRPSAVSAGVCGATFIACVLGVIVMVDIANILKK